MLFKILGYNIRYFLLFNVIIASLLYIVFHTSGQFKNKILKTIGIENIGNFKLESALRLYRIETTFNKEITIDEFYSKLWSVKFNPKDPNSGWGKKIHKTTFPLYGKNVEIIPDSAMGYFMDNTCNANNIYNAYSSTLLGNDSVKKGNIVKASVFCYVSVDFDGTDVRIYSAEKTFGNIVDYYDLNNKGEWQKLSLLASCKNGKAPVYISFLKKGVSNFTSLKGYIIFAYPQYKILGKVNLDPLDPDSGWGYRKHETIFPLTGINADIIQGGTKGYLMDSTCNASTWKNNAYSFTSIGNDTVKLGDTLIASVYCYVSKDFNGEWVKLNSEGQTFGNKAAFYDLQKKETWQKLQIKANCKNGKAPVYLYFSKYGVTDFSTLKGHVIFAYPKYKIIRKDSLQSRIIPKKFKKGETRTNTVLNVFQNSKPKNNLVPDLKTIYKPKNTHYYQAGIFNFSLNSLLSDTSQLDTDPIRNWIAKLVSEDTTYYPYKANIVVDSVSDHFIAPRTVRWQFAWQLFTKEYNWKQKLFGHGFDYLNWYGYYFLNDKTKSDYPHNPFLSVLLYSGVIGLLFYLFVLYKVFYYYIKYLKKYSILFIFFLITFYFSFFSGNNPLNPPIMGFFVMLPFLIHSVHKNQEDKKVNQL